MMVVDVSGGEADKISLGFDLAAMLVTTRGGDVTETAVTRGAMGVVANFEAGFDFELAELLAGTGGILFTTFKLC